MIKPMRWNCSAKNQPMMAEPNSLNKIPIIYAIKANSGRYTIEDAGINSIYSDYGTAIYSNKLVFASARDTGSLGQRKHKWTNQYFTNLYTTDLDADLTPSSKPKKV
jgi:hypothetical protein